MNKEQWILDWLSKNLEASSLNTQFHDDYHAAFGGTRNEKYWGAQPVQQAMKLLAKLEKEGKVVRTRISLGGNWQPGFPKSCLSYSLPTK